MTFKNYSPKPFFLERMKQLLPDEKDFENYLEAIKKSSLNSIRCNTLKIQPDELKKRLEDKGWKIKQPFKEYLEIMIIQGKYARSFQSLTNKNNFINTIHQKDLLDNKLINNKTNLVKLNNKEDNCKNWVNQDNKFSDMDKSIINNSKSLLDNYNNHAKKSAGSDFGATSISEPQRGERTLQHLAPGELGRSLEHQLGYYYIQDISSMLPVLVLNPKENENILDLCASPGSKTTQMASFMENRGTIIANEVKFPRIKILASNLERCGVSNCIITKKDGIDLCKIFEKEKILWDKILVDAPCSGEGTIISNPKTIEMWNIKTIENLSRLQKALLSSAIKILKPNGILVYSTCTHAPEENEEVLDFALKNLGDEIRLERINLPSELKYRKGITKWDFSKGGVDNKLNNNSIKTTDKVSYINNKNRVGGSMSQGGVKFNQEISKSCRIYPQDNLTEGFFIARLRRIK